MGTSQPGLFDIPTIIRTPIKQPGFNGKYPSFFCVAQLTEKTGWWFLPHFVFSTPFWEDSHLD